MGKYLSVDVEVSEVLDQIDDDDLITEVQNRGLISNCNLSQSEVTQMIYAIYEKRRNEQDFMGLLDDFIYKTIGRIS